jgi:glycine cleavage system regulatory protein
VRRLVLTVIGDDRAGLVAALSTAISAHGGNWERSQMAELAGKFAGIVVVAVPDEQSKQLLSALATLDGLLEVAAYPGVDSARAGNRLTIDLLGNDRPGIVREVSAVLSRRGLSIESIETGTREAPMAGGQLFEAHVVVGVPSGTDLAGVRADLERLTAELLVDLDVAQE